MNEVDEFASVAQLKGKLDKLGPGEFARAHPRPALHLVLKPAAGVGRGAPDPNKSTKERSYERTAVLRSMKEHHAHWLSTPSIAEGLRGLTAAQLPAGATAADAKALADELDAQVKSHLDAVPGLTARIDALKKLVTPANRNPNEGQLNPPLKGPDRAALLTKEKAQFAEVAFADKVIEFCGQVAAKATGAKDDALAEKFAVFMANADRLRADHLRIGLQTIRLAATLD